ncbi:MAG TPA: hypothetical protein PLM14_04030 [Candidatus Hydrogenedentes bacterium]|nr:hypothetical protein [Candidatus Hydrogenedentota bacterium]HQE82144.1 hypothetical protein [Candidatus Hydrogenedentota bacterium]HQM51142.1 hypothetical protein [Candidatus Hydrogenedentota bacterium]
MRRSLLEAVYHIRGLLIAPPYLFLCLVFWDECEIDSIVLPAGLTVFLVGVRQRQRCTQHVTSLPIETPQTSQ